MNPSSEVALKLLHNIRQQILTDLWIPFHDYNGTSNARQFLDNRWMKRYYPNHPNIPIMVVFSPPRKKSLWGTGNTLGNFLQYTACGLLAGCHLIILDPHRYLSWFYHAFTSLNSFYDSFPEIVLNSHPANNQTIAITTYRSKCGNIGYAFPWEHTLPIVDMIPYNRDYFLLPALSREIAALKDAYAFEHTMMVLPTQKEFDVHKQRHSRDKQQSSQRSQSQQKQQQSQQQKYQHTTTTTIATTVSASSSTTATVPPSITSTSSSSSDVVIVPIDEYHGIHDYPNLRDVLPPDKIRTLPMYPHVTIHWRCSDNVFLMGLVPYRFVLSRIPSWAQYIFIITDTCYGEKKEKEEKQEKQEKEEKQGLQNQSHDVHKQNHVDEDPTRSHHPILHPETCLPNLKSIHRKNLFCLDVITELVRLIQHQVPDATVVVRSGGIHRALFVSIAMLVYSNVTICSASTFCFQFGQAKTTGKLYLPRAKHILSYGVENLHTEDGVIETMMDSYRIFDWRLSNGTIIYERTAHANDIIAILHNHTYPYRGY